MRNNTPKARADAIDLFLRKCVKGQDHSADDYRGPYRSPDFAQYDARSGSYTFEWRFKNGAKSTVHVRYFYYDIDVECDGVVMP